MESRWLARVIAVGVCCVSFAAPAAAQEPRPVRPVRQIRPQPLPRIPLGDNPRLKQVLRDNLLANAALLTGHGVRMTSNAAELVSLKSGEAVAIRTAAKALDSSVLDKAAFQLPYRIAVPTRETGGERVLVSYVPVAMVEGQYLQFVPGEGRYRAKLLIALVAEGGDAEPAQVQNLARALSLAVVPDVGSCSPRTIAISRTGVPFAQETLWTADRVGARATVRIVPEFDPEGVGIEVPVRRPRVELDVSPDTIPGYGLGKATVLVRVQRHLAEGIGTIRLSTDRGVLGSFEASLDASGAGSVRIRSSGTGTATIEVVDPDLEPASVQLEYAIPVAFAIAAPVGGLLGGILAYLIRRSRKSAGRFPNAVLIGLLSGLIAAAAYSFGVNLAFFEVGELSSEGAVFTLGALVGLFGMRFWHKKPEEA